MKFYDALQLDPAVLKKKIKECQTNKEKAFYWTAMALRAVLIVAFAIMFIGALSNIFGSENAPMAVALFCIILALRFVNFEYCVGDSLVTLAIVLGILLFIPSLISILPSYLLFFAHFFAFFLILYITSQRPELGNGGLYGFAYVYVVGNPVHGEILLQRAELTLVGYIICAALLLLKHRHMHTEKRFHSIIINFSLSSLVNLWQLRLAAGVGLVLTLGAVFGVKRFIWMGFACASLLSEYPYSEHTHVRFWQRIVGVIAGSGAFFILYQIMPEALLPLMAPAGGLCLGFCTDYRYKTAINCFGALMAGTAIYGLHEAVLLRVFDTILGVLIGLIFAWIFHKLVAVKFLPKQKEEITAKSTQ